MERQSDREAPDVRELPPGPRRAGKLAALQASLRSVAYSTYGLRVTDDTEQACAVADALVQGGGMNIRYQDFFQAFWKYYTGHGAFGNGGTFATRSGRSWARWLAYVQDACAKKAGRKELDVNAQCPPLTEETAEQNFGQSMGLIATKNTVGAAMRAGPAGFAPAALVPRLAAKQALVTLHGPVAQLGAEIVAEAVAYVRLRDPAKFDGLAFFDALFGISEPRNLKMLHLRNSRRYTVKPGSWLDAEGQPTFAARQIDELRKHVESFREERATPAQAAESVTRTLLMCNILARHAVPCALFAVAVFGDRRRGQEITALEAAVHFCILRKGDTDTTSAIAGAVLGALWGKTGLERSPWLAGKLAGLTGPMPTDGPAGLSRPGEFARMLERLAGLKVPPRG